tara:strand:- start:6234 stop:6728 length:495 start_codon:yes stop_codon:yes gene_type:complete
MKFFKYIILALFVYSCDGDDSVSSTSGSCNAELAGTWTLAVTGYISDDTGDCTGTAYPTEQNSTNTQWTLNSDCTFALSSESNPCNGANPDQDFCFGNWSSSENTITVIPNYYTNFISFIGSSSFEYQLNNDNSTATQLLPADTSGDNDDTTFNTCQYSQYTKD